MRWNVGTLDRAVRLVIGAVLLATTFSFGVGSGFAYWAMAGVGVAMIITASVGVCPPYALFGIRTCKA